MSIVLDGTSGITSPGGDTATVSVATPIVKSPSSLTLQTNGSTTALTIDTSQNVGIGAAPIGGYGKLQVRNGFAYINEDGAATHELYLRSFWAGVSPAIQVTTNDALTFLTNNTERMRINVGSAVLCLAGGSTTATGTGIAFPATQSASSDANCLDDYEEGTWAPQYGGSVTFGTTTYAVQAGTYVKIGNTVLVQAYVSFSSTTGTGDAVIAGLPFTTNSYATDSRSFSYIFSYGGITFSGELSVIPDTNNTRMLIYSNNAGTIGGQAIRVGAGQIRFQAFYTVA